MVHYIGGNWHKSTKDHQFVRKKPPQILADMFYEEYNTSALGNKPNIRGWEDTFPTEALICCYFVRGACETLVLGPSQRDNGQSQLQILARVIASISWHLLGS